MILFIIAIILIVGLFAGAICLLFCGVREMFYEFEFGIFLFLLGIFILFLAIFKTFAISNTNFRCPECNEWANHEYCEYCGTDINPTVRCPGCDEEYSPDKVPLYCPDCGELLTVGSDEEVKQ